MADGALRDPLGAFCEVFGWPDGALRLASKQAAKTGGPRRLSMASLMRTSRRVRQASPKAIATSRTMVKASPQATTHDVSHA